MSDTRYGRFFTVASGGLIVDIAVASALIIWLGVSDYAAAAIGLFCGMIFNYFLHLRWTFADAARTASLKHFLQFSVGVAITLLARVATLWLIDVIGWQAVLPPPVRLFIGAAVSFLLSYAINRHFIFSEQTGSGDAKGL